MVRLTEEEDMTSESGLKTALNILKDPIAKRGKVLLWAAIPCTGGSAWNRFNWFKGNPETQNRIVGHWKLYRKLWKTYIILASEVMRIGGCVVNEWPARCSYWKDNRVTKFQREKRMLFSDFDGCAYGLQTKKKRNMSNPSRIDHEGELMYILKPWRIMFSENAGIFGEYLRNRCSKEHIHAHAAGSETKGTEDYTWNIAKAVHRAFKGFCEPT